MRNLLLRLIVWIVARKLTIKQLTYVRDIVESRLAKVKKKEGSRDKDTSKGNRGNFPKGKMK